MISSFAFHTVKLVMMASMQICGRPNGQLMG